MMGILLFRSLVDTEVYILWHPVILSVFLFVITVRAVTKERNDRVFGDWHRRDRQASDKPGNEQCKEEGCCSNYKAKKKD
ncbi:MAG: hypothetical protein U9N61_09785 [Euryarchaeota archaeon]|nr:hypothetical protein [Euryarchaeota archaeon]